MVQGIARHNFREPLPYLVATSIVVPSSTWSATNKSASITLDGSLLQASTAAGFDVMGRTDSTISGSQKIYMEYTINAQGGTHPVIGLDSNTDSSFTTFLGSGTASLGYLADGRVFFNSGLLTTIAAFIAGSVLGMAVDFANGHVWWTLDGTTWNNDIIANQNPVGNVGGIAVSIAGTVCPAYSLVDANSTITGDFGATTFTYATIYATLQAAGYTTLP